VEVTETVDVEGVLYVVVGEEEDAEVELEVKLVVNVEVEVD